MKRLPASFTWCASLKKTASYNTITMQKITLDTSDTPYTLDTYSTFTMDNADEYMLETEREANPDAIYDDYDWTYDHAGYLQALADNWQTLMRENILDGVILAINITGTPISPREYNFSTDRAPIEIEYNEKLLQAVIDANRAKYEKEKRRSCDGYMWLGDERDNEIMWYMEHASTALYSPADYQMDQHEQVDEFDYVTYTQLPMCTRCNKERAYKLNGEMGWCRDCTQWLVSKERARDQEALRAKEDRFLLAHNLTREQVEAMTPEERAPLRDEFIKYV